MSDEVAFLNAIRANPDDDTTRLVYADWLDDRDDPRGAFVRLHLALRSVAPDHVHRVAAEQELSTLRSALIGTGEKAGWFDTIEPERAHLTIIGDYRPQCGCFEGIRDPRKAWKHRSVPEFHTEPQDTQCRGWKRLCEMIEEAVADGREEFEPAEAMEGPDWWHLITLPPTIAKLKKVKRLFLYGSSLVRIPPEIGEMESLEEFDPYTSYRLHWFPYEITRCKNLRASRVSTRALYGNYKYRPPFPRLEPGMFAGRVEPPELPLKCAPTSTVRRCSVCDKPFEDRRLYRVWISLRVATDVLPLLVNACSEECVGRLPTPAANYVQVAHRGGPDLRQPDTQF